MVDQSIINRCWLEKTTCFVGELFVNALLSNIRNDHFRHSRLFSDCDSRFFRKHSWEVAVA